MGDFKFILYFFITSNSSYDKQFTFLFTFDCLLESDKKFNVAQLGHICYWFSVKMIS